MSKDVRKEQAALLKFEKKLAGLAVFAAGMTATVASASSKIGSESAGRAYEDVQAAIIHLAEVTAEAHAALEASAASAGARSLEATGGVPKNTIAQVVQSTFGLG